MNKRKNTKWLWYFLGVGLIYEFLKVVFQKKRLKNIGGNFSKFIKKEKREIKELKNGRENWRKFFSDSTVLARDFFIPNKHNDHKPKILRPKSLITAVIFVLILKVSILGYLFLIYPQGARMSADLADRIVELTNRDRIAAGLPSLRVNSVLSASAMARAKDLIMRDYFSHISPDGKKPWDWIDRGEYSYLYVGENLAMNFITAEAVEKALMDSPSHRKNILNERYEDIGVAVLSGVLNGKRTNVLVELFASRASHYLADVKPRTAGTTDFIFPRASEAEKKAKKTSYSPAIKVSPAANKPLSFPTVPTVKEAPPVRQFTSANEEKGAEAELIPKGKAAVSQPELISTFTRKPTSVKAGLQPNKELDAEKFFLRKVAGVGESNVAAIAVKAAYYFMSAILAVIIIALLVNIFVRLRIQHKPIIIQTVIVILFITSLIYFKFHILEFGLTEIWLI